MGFSIQQIWGSSYKYLLLSLGQNYIVIVISTYHTLVLDAIQYGKHFIYIISFNSICMRFASYTFSTVRKMSLREMGWLAQSYITASDSCN